MKTAEEWMKQLGGHDSCGEHPPLISINRQAIKEIQLDAWKQGMSDAAEVVRTTQIQQGDHLASFSDVSPDQAALRKEIEIQRDSKTTI